MAVKIMRGDSYNIPVEVTHDGVPVTPSMVDDIEVSIGSEIQKYYSDGGVFYLDGGWYFRLTQEETFALSEGCEVYVRVAYRGNPKDVIGAQAGRIVVQPTGSSEVL